MPRRNLVWLLVVTAIGVGMVVWPITIVRRDALYQTYSPLLDVRAEVLKHYVEPVDDAKLLRGAIRGMLRSLDPYSDYFDPAEYKQFLKQSQGHFEGVGIEVTAVNGYLTVVSPIVGTPAYAAGVRAGDRILEIDGQDTRQLGLDEAVNRISGHRGSQVRLKLWSPGDPEPREVAITRGLVTVESVKGYRRLDNEAWDYFVDSDAGIGYVRLIGFDEHTAQQLDQAMQAMDACGLRALIIDERDNPGGQLKTAVAIADRFLSDGVIVSTQGRNAAPEVYRATPESDYPVRVPIAVLVNDGSASASEILAGALRDHHRATLIGEKTFGKGSVQNLIELSRNDAIKLTTAHYYLPNGERIDGIGVQPDIEVKLTREEKLALLPPMPSPTTTRATTQPATRPAVDDRQLDRAVDWLRGKLGLPPATRSANAASAPVSTQAAR